MKVFHHLDCLLHNPPHEILSGNRVPYLESPERILLIKDTLSRSGEFDLSDSLDNEIDVKKCILDVHSDEFFSYLQAAYDDWVNDGGSKEAVLPESFPHISLAAKGSRLMTGRQLPVIAKAGLYCFDLSCPITADTYTAILASVHVVLTAAKYLLSQSRNPSVFALCRPPGHHAGSSICGGYCFLNNIAIATRFLQTDSVSRKVAILDIDYHHGNGTQEIFYSDPSVLYVSIHAENDYPYFTGSSQETGYGDGLSYNVNIPLPRGTTDNSRYLIALNEALSHIALFKPDYLAVSLGVDTHEHDPICEFQLTTPIYRTIGQRIRSISVPTLFVMEGGYDLESIGENVANVLLGFNDI